MTADFKQGSNLAGQILASGQVAPSLTLNFNGSPTGGTFTLSVATNSGVAVVTGSQTYAASYAASALQTVLQALSNVGSGNLLVSGSNGGPFTITAAAGFACIISVASTALTGGTSPKAVITAPDTTVYTVPSSSAVKLSSFTLCNVAGITATVSVAVVPSGQTADNTRRVVYQYPLVANDSTKITEVENALLDTGAFITVNANGMLNGLDYLLTGAVSS